MSSRPNVSPPPNLSSPSSQLGLTLVGTIHADPQGFARTRCLLKSLKPDLVFIELSPYGKTYRTVHQSLIQRILNRNLKDAANECGLLFKHALTHPEIKAVRSQIALPFEYRAARQYFDDTGTEWILVDYSPFSRKMISCWAEMLSTKNLASLLSLSRNSRLDISVAYDLAARGILGESSRAMRTVQTNDTEMDFLWEEREQHMASAIRSALRRRRPMRSLYLGGWQHLTLGAHSVSLRGLLEIDLRQCYLLDRGFL